MKQLNREQGSDLQKLDLYLTVREALRIVYAGLTPLIQKSTRRMFANNRSSAG